MSERYVSTGSDYCAYWMKSVAMTELQLPRGFRFAGVGCGIKSDTSAKDISLLVSDAPSVAAGVYTQNQVVAAPVLNCRNKTPAADLRAVVVNSGNANACTGKRGIDDASRMCELVASKGGFADRQTLVMSTGIIGHHLPMRQIEAGIVSCFDSLGDSQQAFLDAADGMLTTDKYRKVAYRSMSFNGDTIHLAGMAKGAGMIGPKMATMLCCVLTDACLSIDRATRLLKDAADASFNNISVEGHTSTNDTMLLLANGQATSAELPSDLEPAFAEQLRALCIELCKQIPADGEGASHLIEVLVRGTESNSAAQTIARAIANSNLVKTAIYGHDPNWGRIVSAAGYAGPLIETSQLQLKVNGILLFDQGEPQPFDQLVASNSIRDNPTTLIELVVGNGTGRCTHWTSDLTVEYVRFNSDYTT